MGEKLLIFLRSGHFFTFPNACNAMKYDIMKLLTDFEWIQSAEMFSNEDDGKRIQSVSI
jgi:hypothetical protein